MVTLDYIVLAVYFLIMAGIGVVAMKLVKAQEDYFMGGRSFGKIMQTFAAFGAGTGSSDPVNTGRTTFTSGMSGMWSVMYWLFVTPFYWFTGVWYRRMRHLTLGDWFVERYQSKAMGAAYAVFGLGFFMVYGSMMFSAIGKVAAPLVGTGVYRFGGQDIPIEYVLVPIIGVVVLLYGILGGLRAAYWTDLVQGMCIILLSILLIPFGLNKLVEIYGDPQTQTMMDGFKILHQQLPPEQFAVVGATSSSEFPWYRIAAIVLINLAGIVVQPHFIATGGGSAKTETNARVGLVVGNFLKRFCTVGWALTALIALALYADSPELAADPDKTWGVASKELLGPGWTGLMLACLLAALMSSADAYMIVGSGLVVRNIYAAYINPNASEKEYVSIARLTGVLVVGGAVVISLFMMDVFAQLQLTWIVTVLFAAPFWVGILWRRATTGAAWLTVTYCAVVFLLAPWLAPEFFPALRTNPSLTASNDVIETTTIRKAAPSDVARRRAAIKLWDDTQAQALEAAAASAKWQELLQKLATTEGTSPSDMPPAKQLAGLQQSLAKFAQAQAALEKLGGRPSPLQVGDELKEVSRTGGESIYWTGGLQAIDAEGNPLEDIRQVPEGDPRKLSDNATEQTFRYPEGTKFRGQGHFNFDLLLFQLCGMDLTRQSNAMLATLSLPPKVIMPFLVMILLSFLTKPNEPEALNRYYAKMKTPVSPDPDEDRDRLAEMAANPELVKQRKLFPNSNLEIEKFTLTDIFGFILCVAACFGIIYLAVLVASLGS